MAVTTVPTWVDGVRSRIAGLMARSPEAPALAGSLLRNLLPLVLLTAGITAVVLMYLWHDQSSYKALFGARDKVNAADMMSALDGAGIPYRIHPDTGQVLVPDAQVGKARMLLASKGVTPQAPAGLELMEHNDPLGVSQFVQDVRFRRGLEGELTQSITTLDAVDSARVHLSVAKSSSFVVSAGEKSSASVMLVLKPGHELSHEQIAAIVTLVSGSVAGLDPQRVTVVDQKGELLSARVDLSDGYQSTDGNDAAQYFEGQARDNIRGLLAPVVGDENYHASVTAEVDNDRVQETHEQYGDAPKVTNESTRQETDKDPVALGVPGSLSNRPITAAAAAQTAANAAPATDANGNPVPPQPAADTSTAQKNASARQYAYDRSVTQINRSRGRLHRLSVAVVLNGMTAPAGKQAWSAEDLANVDRVLRTGLGIDAARGDSLVVSALAFPGHAAPPVWWKDRDNLVDIASWATWPLAALFGWLLIARPMVNVVRARWAAPAPVLAAAGAAALEGPDASGAHKVAADLQAQPVKPRGLSVSPLLENYELPPPGSPVDVLVEHLRVLAAKEPERVAEVVRTWVQKNVRTE